MIETLLSKPASLYVSLHSDRTFTFLKTLPHLYLYANLILPTHPSIHPCTQLQY